ncbi:Hypothetical protein F387_00915 [Wohlfahrtiimonas chitiniclastica SH04]|uniref:Uncharacterized protein n=1 Tax=Wohlfahrtiimonas chitiniclastica SH04 TaxID=1261130 RepID=L8XYD6_9GAMM|nr:Hypothetical protein F387_00915 [Wohlfahrtiimonas chitiniclastica SH04]
MTQHAQVQRNLWWQISHKAGDFVASWQK